MAARSRIVSGSRDPGSSRTDEAIEDGALRIADRGEVAGDYLYYRYAWGADPQGDAVAEARVKVVSGSSFLIVSNGVGGERLGLWPDRIELFHHRDLQSKLDTTGDFHLYRMELKGRRFEGLRRRRAAHRRSRCDGAARRVCDQ